MSHSMSVAGERAKPREADTVASGWIKSHGWRKLVKMSLLTQMMKILVTARMKMSLSDMSQNLGDSLRCPNRKEA